MKKSILLIAAICAVIFQTHAQDQLYASLWYGQIKHKISSWLLEKMFTPSITKSN